jgi:glycosyltransferase involved in cell wall biosynthesis
MSEAAIPLILHVFPGFAVGGAQLRFGQLVSGMGPQFRHRVVSLNADYSMAERLGPELPIEVVKEGALRSPLLYALRCLRAWQPHRLITYNWGSFDWWLAQRVTQTSHVHIEDGFGPEEQKKRFKRRNLARRFVLSNATTTVVVPSKTLLRIARSEWRITEQRLRYIPNGIDCHRFNVQRTDHRRIRIGTLATLRSEKNIPRLLRLFEMAWEKAPSSIELTIVGAGPQMGLISRLARASKASGMISLPGPTFEPEKALASFDVFALTSTTEQMPLSILEAMAAALPVVAFDAGDVQAMLSEENLPFVFPQQDELGFVNALSRLAAEKHLRLDIGRANRRKARLQYDIGAMIEAYSGLFS